MLLQREGSHERGFSKHSQLMLYESQYWDIFASLCGVLIEKFEYICQLLNML